jgi:WD40 repeat protein
MSVAYLDNRCVYGSAVFAVAFLLLGCCPAKPTSTTVTIDRSFSAQPGEGANFLASYVLPVSTVLFSLDGKLLITAGGSWERPDGLIDGGPGEVCIWETATRKRKEICTGYNSWVMSVALSPDGKRLISGGSDVQYSGRGAPRIQGEIRSWTINGKLEWVANPSSQARGLSLSPNRKTLALAGEGGDVMLWNVVGRKGRIINYGKRGIVNTVAFSADGKLLAWGGCLDNLLALWDVETKQGLGSLVGHKNYVRSVVFTPDGKCLASASMDGTVKLWNVSTRKEIATLNGPGGGLQAVAISPDGKLLASGGENKTVTIWDLGTLQELKKLSHKTRVFSLAFFPSGKLLAAGGADKKAPRGVTPGGVTLWDVATGQDVTAPQ